MVTCGLPIGSLDPTAEKRAYFRAHYRIQEFDTADVETIWVCANDVDRLWTPSHESNQRSNYNYH